MCVSVSKMPIEEEDRDEKVDEEAACPKSDDRGKIWVKVRVDVFNARKVKISAYDAMVNPGKV